MSDEEKPTDSTLDVKSDSIVTNNNPSSDNSYKEQNNTPKPNNLLKGTVLAIAVATFFAGFILGDNIDGGESDITRQDITALEEKIENLKLNAPTLQAPQPAQAAQPTLPQVFTVSIDDDPFKGDPDAPVTIVEFSDFQCPFCSRFYQQTLSQLEENYIDTGKVKLVFRDLPLDSIHPNARPTHIAAECADEQGKFWEYHDVLFENQSQWSRLSSQDLNESMIQYAGDLNLDVTSFETCLSSDEIADEVDRDTIEARSYGISGTPSFFVGTEKDGFTKLVGAQPFESFQRAIDSQLE